jgi:hypothetical protein
MVDIGIRKFGSVWNEYNKVEETKTDGRNWDKEEENRSESASDDVISNSASLIGSQGINKSNVSDTNTFKSNSNLSQESEIGISFSKYLLSMPVIKDVNEFTDHENASNNPESNHDFHMSIEEEKGNY